MIEAILNKESNTVFVFSTIPSFTQTQPKYIKNKYLIDNSL